jgi:hypothetical protein
MISRWLKEKKETKKKYDEKETKTFWVFPI